MSHTPDNIRNMWEEAAKRNLDEGNPYRSQQTPGMGSGLDPRGLTAGAREQLRRPKPPTPEELKAKEEAAAKAKRSANANADEKAGLNPGVGG